MSNGYAPEEILYINKPHIGTDFLQNIVKNMREHILSLGGEVKFGTKLTTSLPFSEEAFTTNPPGHIQKV